MFNTVEEIRTFTLAGNATITLKSQVTDKHYTFKVQQKIENGQPQPMWFVKVLSGPDNTSDYTYVGMMRGENPQFGLTKASAYKPDSLPVRGFNFFWKNILAGKMPPQMDMHHMGHCGRCGRPLTHPESIQRGIGPDCWAMMEGS